MTTRLKRDSEEVNQLVEAYQSKNKPLSPPDLSLIGLTRYNAKTGDLEVCYGRIKGELRWHVIKQRRRG